MRKRVTVIISLVIAILYSIIGYIRLFKYGSNKKIPGLLNDFINFKGIIVYYGILIFSLFLIWIPDSFAIINKNETPGCVFKFAGWVILLFAPLYFIFISFL